jgi:flavin reductase (DIM6/NTAB) family NADH-FMN oxidoreductase RutF
MVFYAPHARPRDLLPHDPLKAIVAPRPIGWVSTISAAGAVNLAPYSFFNQIHTRPPILALASEGRKDTIRNLEEVGEFVWNLASFELREAMNASSATVAPGIDEFELAGLAKAPSHLVRPPRVAAAKAALECRLVEIVQLKTASGRALDGWLAIGEVVGVHIDDAVIRDGRVDGEALRAIARCGYDDYALVDALFAMQRPA